MLQAVLDCLPDLVGPCEVSILTTYPAADALEELRGDGRLISATPRQILFPLLPLAMLARLLIILRLDRHLAGRSPAMKAIIEADVVLDLAGISFSDGRSLPILAYNVLMTGIPKLAGAKVVKCSQALGPFRTPLNRLAARLVLPRLDGICARGPTTSEHLVNLGVIDAIEAADLAFLMDVPPAAEETADRLLVDVNTPFVAVAPSSVVRRYCTRHGIDYTALMKHFIDRQIEKGLQVVLLSHSFKDTADESRMNDAPLCREIHARLVDPSHCVLIDNSQPPSVLRAMIGRSHVLVTSRFHAMVSGLSTSTPVVVIGWSHKYTEVMGTFGLADLVVGYKDLTLDRLETALDQVDADRPALVKTISDEIEGVRRSARRNFEMIERVLSRT